MREAIVFIGDPASAVLPDDDIFAAMKPFTVRATNVNDSREAIDQRWEGE